MEIEEVFVASEPQPGAGFSVAENVSRRTAPRDSFELLIVGRRTGDEDKSSAILCSDANLEMQMPGRHPLSIRGNAEEVTPSPAARFG